MTSSMAISSSSSSSVVVLMVPFLAQSHLDQSLKLSHVISSYNIPVHYVSSTLHITQLKSRSSNPSTEIHFHSFEIPLLHPQPQPTDPLLLLDTRTKNFQAQILRIQASTHLREPIAALLSSLSQNSKRLVVVYDVLMSSAVQDVVSLPNAECYSFHPLSVFMGLAINKKLSNNLPIPSQDIPSMESCLPDFSREFLASQLKLPISDFKSGSLHNSCRAIEGSSIEILENEERKLNRKIREIAIGLEESGVKFIWVLREGDKLVDLGKRLSQVPDGFEERMKGMGMVVREWVPQVKILGHSSTGGFMSHCGWNSCMESIGMGVPLLTWPMQSDQPFNALLITKVLKVGVAVMEWSQRNELVTSSMISRGVRRIMGSDSEEGDEIRKRVVEMSEGVKQSVEEGGDCRMEWDSFIGHITR
ncbi:zeatin O-glucosyltransferase [Cannabis sativa]|uniref:zeatin O-glucosyltransferase n=1 Tax=Cannabis sativa TaxID=3483 RepID=UPI0029CA6A51|nr:zeatin O-glucosyltransferase [Cannabis sativa]